MKFSPRKYPYLSFLTRSKQVVDSELCVINIPAGISTKSELLDELQKKLGFPNYFGKNWDALWDVLVDFHWKTNTKIMLRHESLPELDASDLTVYLEILNDAVKYWRNQKNCKFTFNVVFLMHSK